MGNFVRRIKMEYDQFPIFIPSKGRPACPTAKLLKEEGIDFKILIEPQEIEAYKSWKRHLIILPENDQGLVYVRNHILKVAAIKHMGWVWAIDDDINAFCKTVAGKTIKSRFEEVRSYIEPLLRKSNKFAQAAIEYRQYAWSTGGKPAINSHCGAVVALNTPKLKELDITYDSEQFKEDRDITLQILSKGLNTIRFTKYSFNTPDLGTNKGGLHDSYAGNAERLGAFALEKKWGAHIASAQLKKNGRIDAKINWKHFKRT